VPGDRAVPDLRITARDSCQSLLARSERTTPRGDRGERRRTGRWDIVNREQQLTESPREIDSVRQLARGPSACRGLAGRVQHLPSPFRPRHAHAGRVRRVVADQPVTAHITGGPISGVRSAGLSRSQSCPIPPGRCRSSLGSFWVRSCPLSGTVQRVDRKERTPCRP
jgi:hypothetical protein